MCGFTGISAKENIENKIWLTKSSKTMVHRGPDACGEWFSSCKKFGISHRRLSIIDLSKAANQPFIDNKTGCVIAFNGEIYNFKEIKKELIFQGFLFSSNSDTEVLLKAYLYWGVNCLSKLRGMFAFSIFDPRKNNIFLARDPAGEKPLYFNVNDDYFVFASELRALFEFPFVKRNLDWDTVDSYLTMGFVSGSNTLINGISKLPPAHAMIFSMETRKIKKWKYWTIPPAQEQISNYSNKNYLVNRLEKLLEKSISQQLEADVPIGVLLSGGIDSSIITALASRQTKKLMTFTVGIKDNPEYDESSHADLIAKHFSTNHHLMYEDFKLDEIFEKLSMEFDEPIIDSSFIPTYMISQFVRKNCKVVLGGDGGDELFGGYGHYRRLHWLKNKLRFFPLKIRSGISDLISHKMNTGIFGNNISNWINVIGSDLENGLPLIGKYFTKNERINLLSHHLKYIQNGENNYSKIVYNTKSIIERSTRTDFHTYLPEDLLVKVDRASMLNSLEVRSPFLNLDVIEFAFSKVPDFLKVGDNNKKVLLKALGEKILPKQFDFSRKQGFSIPLRNMFSKEPLKSLMKDTLLSANSIFDKQTIENLFILNVKGYANTESLFGILMLQLWINKFNIKF